MLVAHIQNDEDPLPSLPVYKLVIVDHVSKHPLRDSVKRNLAKRHAHQVEQMLLGKDSRLCVPA